MSAEAVLWPFNFHGRHTSRDVDLKLQTLVLQLLSGSFCYFNLQWELQKRLLSKHYFFFFNERCYKYVWWLRWNYLLFHLSPVDGNATKIIFPCSRHHHPQKNWLSVKLFYSNGQCCGYTIKQLQTEKTQNNQHREKRNKKIYMWKRGNLF